MRRPLQLEISRVGVQTRRGSTVHEYPPGMVLVPSDGEVKVAGVGERLGEVEARIAVEVAKGTLPPSFTLRQPGQVQWWDQQLSWPPRGKSKDGAPLNDSEALFTNPFAAETWCPPVFQAYFLYVLHMEQTAWERRIPGLCPVVNLDASQSFSPLELAEILDALCDAGAHRIEGLPQIPRIKLWRDRLRGWILGAIALVLLVQNPKLGVPQAHRFVAMGCLVVVLLLDSRLPSTRTARAPRRT